MYCSAFLPEQKLVDCRFPSTPPAANTFAICRTDTLKPFLYWYKPSHVIISTYGCKPTYITGALDDAGVNSSIIFRDRLQTKRSWHATSKYGTGDGSGGPDSGDDEPYASSQGSSQLSDSRRSSLDERETFEKKIQGFRTQADILEYARIQSTCGINLDDIPISLDDHLNNNNGVRRSKEEDEGDDNDNDAHSISSDVSNVSFGNNEVGNVLRISADMNYESANGKHQFIDLASTYVDDNGVRRRPRGTVHSKYVLGFSEGKLHLCIATANFSGATDQTDGYWCGTFPRVENGKAVTSSFGKTFLEHLKQQLICSLCIRETPDCQQKTARKDHHCPYCLGDLCERKVVALLKEVDLDCVDDLLTHYDWVVPDGVEMVTSRPGKIARKSETQFYTNPNPKDEETDDDPSPDVQHLLCAGDQVAEILEKHKVEIDKEKDKLYIQPTSIGNRLNAAELHEYCNSLSRGECSEEYRILWPRYSNNNNLVFWKDEIFQKTPYEVLDALYKYDIDISRFGRYHHFKSIFMQDGELNDESRMRFKYFLMTSCCLSVGAIGANANRGLMTTEKEYKNFEMGVMFISKQDRLYTNYQDDQHGTTIKLPLPFTVGPRYLDDETGKFSEWPKIQVISTRLNLGLNGVVLPDHPELVDKENLLEPIYKDIETFCQTAKPGQAIRIKNMFQKGLRFQLHQFCDSCCAGLQHYTEGKNHDEFVVSMPGLRKEDLSKKRTRPDETVDEGPPMPSFDD
ncbi:hypothetical protein TrST_g13521 [Triparma strigata]|uniref:Uncharacterized protein n=1 Tax=Triparma strigata TaxID=1606541 RepID=A0A9W7A8T4_9STRA|nr:hypothetical protein TrST_g13521 [Triparma strigata]